MPVGRSGGGHINPTTPTQGHFVLSPVSLASRDQDDGPVELNERHLRSQSEQSKSKSKCETILMKMTLICMKMRLHAELIFISKVLHLDSF